MSVNTLGLVPSSTVQRCPEKEWPPPLASFWGCPRARQREGMNGNPSARTKLMPAWSRELRGQLSGPGSLDQPLLPKSPPSHSGGVAWPGAGILGFSSPPNRVTGIWAASQAGDPWGQMCSLLSPPLPCPELRDGRPASPDYCLRCCRQPLSSPAPPLACKVCFPNSCSNHTPPFREEPLLFLPPSLIRGGTEEEG